MASKPEAPDRSNWRSTKSAPCPGMIVALLAVIVLVDAPVEQLWHSFARSYCSSSHTSQPSCFTFNRAMRKTFKSRRDVWLGEPHDRCTDVKWVVVFGDRLSSWKKACSIALAGWRRLGTLSSPCPKATRPVARLRAWVDHSVSYGSRVVQTLQSKAIRFPPCLSKDRVSCAFEQAKDGKAQSPHTSASARNSPCHEPVIQSIGHAQLRCLCSRFKMGH